MSKKIAIYTAVFGEYDGLLPQKKFSNVDYICFTDQPFKSRIWKIINVTPQHDGGTLDNRYIKICPHLFLKDYDTSIYIDGNFLIRKDPSDLIEEIFREHLMGIYDHNQTSDDKRACVFEEAEALYKLDKEGNAKVPSEIVRKQMNRYKSEGYPANNGLISGGILVRKHHTPSVIATMEAWWHELQTEAPRDQLSFNYVAWKQQFNYYVINGDIRNNHFFHMIGRHRKSYKKKYFRYRLKKIFGLK